MEPILSKQEIADLLQTLQKDGAVPPQQSSTDGHTITYDHREVNLFELAIDVQQRLELPNFNLIIDQFQSAFSRSLGQHLQKTIIIKGIDFQSKPFREYLSVDDRYRLTGALSLKPLSNGCLLTYDANLWSLMLEILLGSVSASGMAAPDRSPTKLEMNLLSSSIELACQALAIAFLPVMLINCSLARTANDPKVLSFVSPESIVAIHRFEIQVDEAAGILELVFPFEALAPCREPLQKLTQLNSLSDRNWSDIIALNLESIPITVMAQCSSLELSIRQLVDLKVGDFIPISREPESGVDLLVQGVRKFSGMPEERNHKRNVRITKVL